MSGHKLTPVNGFIVRWREVGDIDSFTEIDTNNAEYLWTRDDFNAVFRQDNVGCFVVTNVGRVAGFLIYEKGDFRNYILNLSVHPDYYRQGVGSMLLKKLKSKLDAWRPEIRFDVRESNLAAQLFLKSNDFKAEKILSDYFLDFYGDEENPEKENAYSFYYRTHTTQIHKEEELCVGR